MSLFYLIYEPEEDVYMTRCVLNSNKHFEVTWGNEEQAGWIDPEVFYTMMSQGKWLIHTEIRVVDGKLIVEPLYRLDDICKWWFVPVTDEDGCEIDIRHDGAVQCGEWFFYMEEWREEMERSNVRR